MNKQALAEGRRDLLIVALVLACARVAAAVPVGQGTLTLSVASDFLFQPGGGGSFNSTMTFDDKLFQIKPPGSAPMLNLNFSVLGAFTADGHIDLQNDESGTFGEFATNTAGDLELLVTGEYIDRTAGTHAGDQVELVGELSCTTTRTDDFQKLCTRYALSFNALLTVGPPDAEGHIASASGDVVLRAIALTGVWYPGGTPTLVGYATPDPNGDFPWADFRIQNDPFPALVHVITLADTLQPASPRFEFGPRGITSIDHGNGAVPFFPGGDERFIKFEVMPSYGAPSGPRIQVCLPRRQPADPSDIRTSRMVLSTATTAKTNQLIDRTVRLDGSSTLWETCGRFRDTAYTASHSGYFVTAALLEEDTCGGGQGAIDGMLTVVAGLAGQTTTVVDGVSNCLNPNLPRDLSSLQRYCVPDADSTPGQCSVSITLGINRGRCNRGAPRDPHDPLVQLNSYQASLQQGQTQSDVTALFGPLIAALNDPVDSTVGPVNLVLPVVGRVTTYKLKQQLSGTFKSGHTVTDKDVLTIKCLDPTQF